MARSTLFIVLVGAAAIVCLSHVSLAAPPPVTAADEPLAAQTPEVVLRLAQHIEFIEGDLAHACSLYSGLTGAAPGVAQEAAIGLARSLRKLGRADEARQELAALDDRALPPGLRTRLLEERTLLSRPGPVPTAAGVAVVARPRPTGEDRPGSVSLELKDVTVGQLVQHLARQGRLNVVVTPSVSDRKVTVSLSDVGTEEALQTVARAAGARLDRWNDTWTVASPEESGRMGLEESRPATRTTTQAVLVALRLYAPDEGGGRRLLASPRLLVLDGQHGNIRIGSRRESGQARPPRPDPSTVSAAWPKGSTQREYDVDISVRPTVVGGTDRVRLKLDVSASRSEETTGGVRVHQQRRQMDVSVKDGASAAFSLDSQERGVGAMGVEVQALTVQGTPLR